MEKFNIVKEKLESKFKKLDKKVADLEEGGVFQCFEYLLSELRKNNFTCKLFA